MEKVKPQYVCRHQDRQRGIAMLEFIIVMPLLFFFSIAVVDMARWVNLYIATSRVAYEGVRFAASISGMPEGAALVNPYGTDIIPSDAHAKVVARIQNVMTIQGMPMEITSMRVERILPNEENSVEVELQVPFEPLSVRFVGWKVFQSLSGFMWCRSTVKAPYLFSANS